MNSEDLSTHRRRNAYSWVSGLLQMLLHPLVLMGTITLLGAALRLYNLGKWSFWIDEYYTVRDTATPGAHIPPRITNYLIKWMFDLFSVSEWSARLVPCIIGIASIPILYLVTRRMFNSATATLAALLLAVAPWHIYWSQNARFYALLMLFYTLGVTLFYEGVEKDNRGLLGLSAVFLVLAVWEHATAVLAVVIVVGYLILIVVLCAPRPSGLRIRNILVFLGVSVVLAIPLAIFTLPSVLAQSQATQIATPNNNPLWILMGVAFYIRLPVLCVGIFGGLYLLINRQQKGALLGLWITIPLLVLLVLTFFTYTANRYVFVTLPAWIILASFGTVELFTQTKEALLRVLILGLPLLLFADSLGEDVLYHRYQNGNRADWKGAFQFIKARQQPGDLIITTKPEIGQFYLQEPVLGFYQLESLASNGPDQRIWFVEDMNINQVRESDLIWVSEHAQQVITLDNVVGGRNFRMRVFLHDPQFPPVLSSKVTP
jgi:mannosyltransferase